MSLLLSRIHASAVARLATTIRSPVRVGCPLAAPPRRPPSTINAAPNVDPKRAAQPIQSSRSPAKIAAATARRTGMEPTISEAWLTVVREPVKLDQKLNRYAERRRN